MAKAPPAQTREERLAAALRANLRRRKAGPPEAAKPDEPQALPPPPRPDRDAS